MGPSRPCDQSIISRSSSTRLIRFPYIHSGNILIMRQQNTKTGHCYILPTGIVHITHKQPTIFNQHNPFDTNFLHWINVFLMIHEFMVICPHSRSQWLRVYHFLLNRFKDTKRIHWICDLILWPWKRFNKVLCVLNNHELNSREIRFSWIATTLQLDIWIGSAQGGKHRIALENPAATLTDNNRNSFSLSSLLD